jgi:hypothetical protein
MPEYQFVITLKPGDYLHMQKLPDSAILEEHHAGNY